jgi:hypothetical protein
MNEPMVHAPSPYGYFQSTMKVRTLTQARPLGKGLDPERLLIFAWNDGSRAYNPIGLIASQWQILNP